MNDEETTNESTNVSVSGLDDATGTDPEADDSKETETQKKSEAEVCNSTTAERISGTIFQGGKAHTVGGNIGQLLQFFITQEQSSGEHNSWTRSEDPDQKEAKKEPGEPKGTENTKRGLHIWLELTIEMIAPRSIGPAVDQAELVRNLRDLRGNGLIFITCADEQMAKACAYSLLEQLNLPDPEQRRLLDFGRIGTKPVPEISKLFQRDGVANELAVVVDLFNPKSAEFLDSLIDSIVHSSDLLRAELSRSKLFLVCVVHAAELCKKLNAFEANDFFNHDRPFPHWNISFLRPLLQHHFPDRYKELEAKILERRNMWEPDDRTFCHQLKALIQEGSLVRVLEHAYKIDDLPAPPTLFKNEDVLIDTVLYVGTFFSDLKPREFHRVVNVLLGQKTKTFTVSTTRKNENGSIEQVEVERERLLTDLWQESTDRIKAQCCLTASPALDGATIVAFKSHQLRDELADFLRAEYGFFLNNKFEQLMDAGLLFDSSANIGNNMIRLAAESAVADPEYFEEWFRNVLEELSALITLPASTVSTAKASAAPIVQPLAALDPREVHTRFCQRLSSLIRRMLEVHQLKDMANDVLEQLMRRQLFGKVLAVVRSLRFAAEFDEFHWFKQLIERGHDECRKTVGFYLADRMQNAGARIYQMLRGMDPWVKVDPSTTPSRSGREALCLLIDFCVKNTIYFPPDRYGAWPTSHPFFRFADSNAATENLRLLSRWLFHPWMQTIIAEKVTLPAVNYSIGILIAEWIFILLQPLETTQLSTGVPQAYVGLTPQQVVRILIEQTVAASDHEQREDLLRWWQSRSADLMREIEKLQYVNEVGSAKIWKRNLLNDLVTQFKICVYDRQMLEVAHA